MISNNLVAPLLMGVVLFACSVVGGPVNKARVAAGQRKQTVNEILAEVPLIDGHNDFPFALYNNVQNQLERVDLNQSLIGVWDQTHTDIPRLRQGRVGAVFWVSYSNCLSQYKDAVRHALEQIDVIHRFVNKYPETFQFARSADEILAAFAAGKIGSLIGVEGGHLIDSSLGTLRQYYDMGVRYLTLTHNCDTPWSDTWSTNPDGRDGLSDFGKRVIDEMNRLGMLIDLSHVSTATMRAALTASRAPIIFSHSSAFALCNHGRNVPDDILDLVRFNNGVVMVNFYNDFVTCTNVATVRDVADHIDYIKNHIGVEYVGIGSDYDGVSRTPTDLEDVSKFPNLFQELQNRGWSDTELKQLAGENLLRVLRAAEQVSRDLQSTKPAEDLIPINEVSDTACRSRN